MRYFGLACWRDHASEIVLPRCLSECQSCQSTPPTHQQWSWSSQAAAHQSAAWPASSHMFPATTLYDLNMLGMPLHLLETLLLWALLQQLSIHSACCLWLDIFLDWQRFCCYYHCYYQVSYHYCCSFQYCNHHYCHHYCRYWNDYFAYYMWC